MNSKIIKYLTVSFVAFFNSLSVCALKAKNPSQAFYIGVDSYGFSYESVFWFALSFILLLRFVERLKEKATRRLIFSVIFGLLIAIATVWGTYIIYPKYSIFGSGKEVLVQLGLILGVSLFSVPLSDELFSWFDARASLNFFENSDIIPSREKEIMYFLLAWLAVFLCFLPLFLHFWPGSFGVDARDQLGDYLMDNMSDHHPIMHTLLLGWAYDIGVKLGDASKGIQFYTLFQMLVLSASFAFFSEFLLVRRVKKWLRLCITALFVLIPLNGYFAILTAKVTLGAAFMLFSLTFFLRLRERIGNIWVNRCLFVFTAVLACLFRNNAVYAYILGGIVIACLTKGIREKIIFLLMVAFIVIGNNGSKAVLVKSTNARAGVDTCRESLALPIMCLVRTAINHEDELPEEYLSAINAYVPKEVYSQYVPTIADNIKKWANEDLLRNNKLEFLKLFVKVGLRFPGEYLEQFCFMTGGYWFTLDYPYCYGGSTSVFWQTIPLDVEQVKNKDFLPIAGNLLDRLYIDTERLSVPIFGFFFRGTIYTWFTLFVMLYGIYRSDKERIAASVIPFVYLLTVFCAPTSFIRYLYCNVATLPLMLWIMFDNREDM